MLILVRKKGEIIKIGKDIYIHFKEVHNNRVVVGVDAPRDIPVFRAELLEEPVTDTES